MIFKVFSNLDDSVILGTATLIPCPVTRARSVIATAISEDETLKRMAKQSRMTYY